MELLQLDNRIEIKYLMNRKSGLNPARGRTSEWKAEPKAF